MSARGARARVGRAVSALLAVGAVGALTTWGSQGAVPAPVTVGPSVVGVPAAARSLVCPGPLALPAEDGTGDAAFDPTPAPTLTTQRVVTLPTGDPDGGATAEVDDAAVDRVGTATLTPLGGGSPLLELGADGAAAVGDAPDATSAAVLQAAPTVGQAAAVAGAAASVTVQGDLRGLAAASCAPPAAVAWLVGGSTEIGSSALLVVTNTGRTPAEVSVRVFGPNGPVETPGATFLVAPGAERGLLLEGVAAEQRRLAVEVTAAGGLVTAHVQDTRLNGFTPAGTDLVTAGVAPSTRQVVAGLVVPTTSVGDADAAQVRLLATDGPASVTLTLLGPGGPVALPGADRIELRRGEVTDVSLAGLPPGGYTAVVDADGPVVAGAMLTRRGAPVELGDIPTLERAWVPSADAGAGDVVAVPAGVVPAVVIGAVAAPGARADAGAAEGTLRLLGTDGALLAEAPLSVPAGTTVTLDPAALAGGRPVAAVRVLAAGTPSSGTASSGTPSSGTASSGTAPALAWAVPATVGAGPDELLSVLTPVPGPDEQPTVRVRAGARLGLP